MKKISFDNIPFEKIYLTLSLAYSILFPIYMMGTFKLGFFNNIYKNLNSFILIISIIALIVFIFETIIKKINIFDFIKSNKSILVLITSFIFLTISCLLADDLKLSLIGNSFRFGGLLSFFFYGVLAILGYKLNEKNRSIFFRSLIYMTTFISIFSIIKNDFTKQFLFIENAGIFTNINHFSTYLCYILIINIFVFYNDKSKWLAVFDFLCFIISTGMLIINTSFACYLTIMFIIMLTIVFAIKNKKILKFLAMAGVFVTISITGAWMLIKGNFLELFQDLELIQQYQTEYADGTKEQKEYFFESCLQYIGSYRGEMWRYGIDMIKEKPILGYGLENFSDDYKKYPLESGEDLPHNLIIFLWLSGGIFTLLTYLIANVMLLWKNKKCFYINNSNTIIWYLIIGHLIQSMFNNTLFYTTALYAILFGMLFKEFKQKKDN